MKVLIDITKDKNSAIEDSRKKINCTTLDGFTPVHYCCHKGSLKLLKYLISEGGDVKLASHKGVSCVHLASASGKL